MFNVGDLFGVMGRDWCLLVPSGALKAVKVDRKWPKLAEVQDEQGSALTRAFLWEMLSP
jgi:hypothetical protein